MPPKGKPTIKKPKVRGRDYAKTSSTTISSSSGNKKTGSAQSNAAQAAHDARVAGTAPLHPSTTSAMQKIEAKKKETAIQGMPVDIFNQEAYNQQLTDFAKGLGQFAEGTQQAIQNYMGSTGKVFDITQSQAYRDLEEAAMQGFDLAPIIEKYAVPQEDYQATYAQEQVELAQPQVAGVPTEQPQMVGAEIPQTPAVRQGIEQQTVSAYPSGTERQFSQDFQTGYAAGTIEDPNERNISAVENFGSQGMSSVLDFMGSLDIDNMSSGDILKAGLLMTLQTDQIQDQRMDEFFASLIDNANQAFYNTVELGKAEVKELDKIIAGEEVTPTSYASLQAKIMRAQKNIGLESIETEKDYAKKQRELWMKDETAKRARLEGYMKSKLVGMGAQDSTAGLQLLSMTANQADLRLQMADNEYNHGLARLNLQSRDIMHSYLSGIETILMDTKSREDAAAAKREDEISKIMQNRFLDKREREKLQAQTFTNFFKESATLKEKQAQRQFELMKHEYQKIVDARDYAYQISGLTGSVYVPGANGELVNTGMPTFDAQKWKNNYLLDIAEFEHKQQYDQYGYALKLAQYDLDERRFDFDALYKSEQLQLERDKYSTDTSMSMFELDISKMELDMAYQEDMLNQGLLLADYGLSGDEIADATGLEILRGIQSPEAVKNEIAKQEQLFAIQTQDFKIREQELKVFKEKFDIGITMIDQGAVPAEVEERLGLPTGFFKGVTSKEAMKKKLENKYDMFEIEEARQQLESHNAELKLKALSIKTKAVELAKSSNENPDILRVAEQLAGLPEYSLDGLSSDQIEDKINEKYISRLFTIDQKYQYLDQGAEMTAAGVEGTPNPINVAFADGYKEQGLECGTFMHRFFDIPPMGDSLISKIKTMDNILMGGIIGDTLSKLGKGIQASVKKGIQTAYADSLPKVGDMIIFDVGTQYGHVAIANRVKKPSIKFPQGSAILTESNYGEKWTVFNTREVSLTDPRIVGIHRGDLNPQMNSMIERYDGILGEAMIDWNAFAFKMEEIKQGKEVSEKEREQLETWSWDLSPQIYSVVNDAIREGEKVRREYLSAAEAEPWKLALQSQGIGLGGVKVE